MDRQSELQQLFTREQTRECLGIPILSYARLGDPMKPLVVFLTGGGVLARVAYGHPQGRRTDFLDHWLEEQGWGLLTASYPGDHPVFPTPRPNLQLEEWASALAELVAEAVGEAGRRPIIACGWSMGGKLVFALSHALRRRNHALECFVSFSATPPFPRLDGNGNPPESLLANGLWNLAAGSRDGFTRDERWLEELAAIEKLEGHCVIDPTAFREFYRTNVPAGLWGPEINPYFENTEPLDLSPSLQGASTFSGDDYPICSAIIPLDARDYRHALTDEAVWGAITVKAIVHNGLRSFSISQLSHHDWTRLRARIVDTPRRLTRYLPGGHFFFVGANGARATVAHLIELHDEMQLLDAFFKTFKSVGNAL